MLTSCGPPQPTPKEIYLAEELPIIQRHNETLYRANKAMEAIASESEKPATSKDKPSASSKTQMEAIETPEPPHSVPVPLHILTREEVLRSFSTRPLPNKPTIPSGLKEALTSGVDTLDWALNRIDSEILDYKRLNPPSEVRTYHGLMVETWLKEQAIYTHMSSNYISLLSYGHADDKALDRLKRLSEERQILWLLTQHVYLDHGIKAK